jgi:hypothetical protein
VADPIAGDRQVQVGRVGHVAQSLGAAVRLELRAPEREQRPDHVRRTPCGDAGETGQTAAAEQAEQNRLCLVIGLMSGDQKAGAESRPGPPQELIAELSGLRLVLGDSRRTTDPARHFPEFTQLADPLGIRPTLLPHAMVKVSRRDGPAPAIPKRQEKIEQNH